MERGLKKYTLSQLGLDQLRIIKEALREDISRADPTWKILAGKTEEKVEADNEDTTDEEERNDDRSEPHDQTQLPFTQFHFTQVENSFYDRSLHPSIQKFDIVEYLYENLERANGKLDLGQLENLSDEELLEVLCHLEKKLSVVGTYNLCRSTYGMDLQQRARYASLFYNHALLPKIIGLEEPSRLLLSAVTECVRSYPDDAQKWIFVPLLNVEPKDPTLVNAMVKAFGPERNAALVKEVLKSVKELKPWHVPILQSLLSSEMEHDTKSELLRLFLGKASDFSKDKNFGRLILSFVKLSSNFSDAQRNYLREITDIHQTLFKKPIENILRSA